MKTQRIGEGRFLVNLRAVSLSSLLVFNGYFFLHVEDFENEGGAVEIGIALSRCSRKTAF